MGTAHFFSECSVLMLLCTEMLGPEGRWGWGVGGAWTWGFEGHYLLVPWGARPSGQLGQSLCWNERPSPVWEAFLDAGGPGPP